MDLRRSLTILPIILLLLCGCVSQRPAAPPATATIPTLPVSPMADLAPLRGRTLCIDPGHGGPWAGAVAPSNNLRESDVNLRVALRLAQLLTQAGARPVLTRRTDAALDPGNLSNDLARRAAVAGTADAELFVSIHHNATTQTQIPVNDLKVFYNGQDDGPSLDLAQCLMHSLAARLRPEAESKLLLPGSYSVLRHAPVPAVLLESSYMTDPANAAFLATQQAIDAEAEAILAGLAAYFALDPPSVRDITVETAANDHTHALRLRFARGFPLDGASLRVQRNGQPAAGEYAFSGQTLTWTFANPLPNADNTILITGRNFRSASFRYGHTLSVNRPPAHILIRQYPGTQSRTTSTRILFETTVTDQFGFSVANGTSVIFDEPGLTSTVQDGRARFYVSAKDIPDQCTFLAANIARTHIYLHDTAHFRSLHVNAADAVATHNGHAIGVATSEGWVIVPSEIQRVLLTKQGYHPRSVSLTKDHTIVSLEPVRGGVLHNKKILIDPSFGGRESGPIGFSGTRSSDINLDLARRAAGKLRYAGAEVTLARSGDQETPESMRIALANAGDAAIYVAIATGAEQKYARLLDDTGHDRPLHPPFTAHYPNSKNGMRLGAAIAGRLGIEALSASVAYVIQQSACPAVLISPSPVSDEALHAPETVQTREAIAQGIYEAIADYFAE